MRTPTRADFLRNLTFVVLVPGVVGGLIPWLITGYRGYDWGRFDEVLGVIACGLIIGGVFVLLSGVWRFATDGRGTPSPTAPAQRLVIAGPYRYVRNPMYIAVGAVIAGQALLCFSWPIVGYLVAFTAAVIAFVLLYEEPSLARTFGTEYEEYRRTVPRWIPRPPR